MPASKKRYLRSGGNAPPASCKTAEPLTVSRAPLFCPALFYRDQPALVGGQGEAQAAVFRRDRLSPHQVGAAFPPHRQADGKTGPLPVVVHRHDDPFLIQQPGKGILAVGEQQLLVPAMDQGGLLPADASQCSDPVQKSRVVGGLQRPGKVHRRAEGIVVAPLLPARYPPLGAVVDGGDARKGEEQGMDRVDVPRLLQLGGDAVHVVVIYKGVEPHPPVDAAVLVEFPADGVGDLEVVVVVVAGVQPLVQFVVGDAVQLVAADVPAVVPVDDLPHEPEVRLFLIHAPAHLLEEGVVQAVGAVQPDAVDVKGVDPEADDIQDVVPHPSLPVVQIYQLEAVPPGLVAKAVVVGAVPAEVEALVPGAVGGVFPIPLNILEGEKLPAGVVEHAVHHHTDAFFVGRLDKPGEVIIIPQAAVHRPVVPGVIAVGGGLEQGADVDRCAAQRGDVGQPALQLPEAVGHLLALVPFGRAGHAQGVHVVKDRFLEPFCHFYRSP